jgi:hypothetical protein
MTRSVFIFVLFFCFAVLYISAFALALVVR